jgi:hypothetical protein
MSDQTKPPEGGQPQPKKATEMSAAEYAREKRKLLDDVRRQEFDRRSAAAGEAIRARKAEVVEQRGVAERKKPEPPKPKPSVEEQMIAEWRAKSPCRR